MIPSIFHNRCCVTLCLWTADNIFRFIQAGSEVSGLLGRLPARVGYQPTMATELAELEERISNSARGSITSLQAVNLPADDFGKSVSRVGGKTQLPAHFFSVGVYIRQLFCCSW